MPEPHIDAVPSVAPVVLGAFREMTDAVQAVLKVRKPKSNEGRAEYVEELSVDLERVKDALAALTEMTDAVQAVVKLRKPESDEGRAELSADLERVKDALVALTEMTDELVTAVSEVGEAETMAEMRDNLLIEGVREKAQMLLDALTDGVGM